MPSNPFAGSASAARTLDDLQAELEERRKAAFFLGSILPEVRRELEVTRRSLMDVAEQFAASRQRALAQPPTDRRAPHMVVGENAIVDLEDYR